jgi:hypothetical protein
LARVVQYTSLGRWRSWVQIPATPPITYFWKISDYDRVSIEIMLKWAVLRFLVQ